MYSTKQIYDILLKELEVIKNSKEQSNFNDIFRYVFDMGGKHIRPLFVLMSYSLFKKDIHQALYPAISIEAIHNSSLIHDDIIDNSNIRRGKPSVHKKWNVNLGILSGTVMIAQAYKFMMKLKPDIFIKVIDILNQSIIKMHNGQYEDIQFQSIDKISMDQYMNMIKNKTAELFAASLKIGAIIAKADDRDVLNLYEFGKNLGLAFQIQDDYLDVFGSQKKIGKKIGNDIIEKKKTFLYVKTLELCDDKDKFLDLFKNKSDNFKNIKKIYESLKVKDITKKAIYSLYNDAIIKINSVKTKYSHHKDNIITLINDIINREG